MAKVVSKVKEKKTIQRKPSWNKKHGTISFRPTLKVRHIIDLMYDNSKFINQAIIFSSDAQWDPEKIMIELKKRAPGTWKRVNRKKFL